MLSVKGIYYKGEIKFLEKIRIECPKDVIITFLDKGIPEVSNDDLYSIAEQNGSFDFLKEPEEDRYTDSNLKKKYK
jgi:hypothetical protein